MYGATGEDGDDGFEDEYEDEDGLDEDIKLGAVGWDGTKIEKNSLWGFLNHIISLSIPRNSIPYSNSIYLYIITVCLISR